MKNKRILIGLTKKENNIFICATITTILIAVLFGISCVRLNLFIALLYLPSLIINAKLCQEYLNRNTLRIEEFNALELFLSNKCNTCGLEIAVIYRYLVSVAWLESFENPIYNYYIELICISKIKTIIDLFKDSKYGYKYNDMDEIKLIGLLIDKNDCYKIYDKACDIYAYNWSIKISKNKVIKYAIKEPFDSISIMMKNYTNSIKENEIRSYKKSLKWIL